MQEVTIDPQPSEGLDDYFNRLFHKACDLALRHNYFVIDIGLPSALQKTEDRTQFGQRLKEDILQVIVPMSCVVASNGNRQKCSVILRDSHN